MSNADAADDVGDDEDVVKIPKFTKRFSQLLKRTAIAVGVLWILVFAVQYACLRFKVETRPSDLLWWAANWLEFLWEQAGRWAAWCSGFLDWLEWKDIVRTFNDIQHPITEMLLSPFQFICGYVAESRLYQHPAVVYVGGLMLLVAIAGVLWRYTRLGDLARRYWDKCFEWQLPPLEDFGPDPHTKKQQ